MNTPRLAALVLMSAGVLPLSAADAPPASAPTAAASTVPAAPTGAEVRAVGLPATVAPDAVVTKLAGDFGFTEGATTAPNGDVYFVDQNNNKILKWDVTAAKLSTFLEPAGRSNGQYFDGKGNLIACADEKNELWSIAPDGKHTVLISAAGYQGRPLDGPNDVWVGPDGGIYVTDPLYRRTWWDAAVTRPSQEVRAVYFLDPSHKTLTRVAEFTMPNGIVGTPDGKTLYVSDINARQILAFDIQADGALTNRRLICNFGADGFTLDDRGNLYLSANLGGGARGGRGARGGAPAAAPVEGTAAAPAAAPAPAPAPVAAAPAAPAGPTTGVTVVEIKTGKVIGFIPVPEQPANMAFGGKDRSTLYITARTGFYSIPTKVKGANAAK
jgi:gluconolactonase